MDVHFSIASYCSRSFLLDPVCSIEKRQIRFSDLGSLNFLILLKFTKFRFNKKIKKGERNRMAFDDLSDIRRRNLVRLLFCGRIFYKQKKRDDSVQA